MPMSWHYHHHASLMRWYVLDHEQFLSFSILFSSHHSGTSWSLSHLSIGCCSRTVKAFLDVLRLTNGLHLVVNPLYSLWWSLLLIVNLTHIHLLSRQLKTVKTHLLKHSFMESFTNVHSPLGFKPPDLQGAVRESVHVSSQITLNFL